MSPKRPYVIPLSVTIHYSKIIGQRFLNVLRVKNVYKALTLSSCFFYFFIFKIIQPPQGRISGVYKSMCGRITFFHESGSAIIKMQVCEIQSDLRLIFERIICSDKIF